MRTQEQKIAQFIAAQFEGKIDDNWVECEEETVVLLQDRFGLSEEQAIEEIKKVF